MVNISVLNIISWENSFDLEHWAGGGNETSFLRFYSTRATVILKNVVYLTKIYNLKFLETLLKKTMSRMPGMPPTIRVSVRRT